MGKNIGKNIRKGWNSKYSWKFLDHAKQCAIFIFKTSSKRVIQKSVEATSDLTGNKVTYKITKPWKTSPNIIPKQIKKKRLEKKIY